MPYYHRVVKPPQPSLISADGCAALRPPPLLVQVTSREAYSAGHPPGAVLVAPEELVSGTPPVTGALPSAERLTRLFRRIGLAPDREVVLFDDEGGGWAGRLAWTLDVVGHPRWRYLDGGLRAWRAAGLPLKTAPAPSAPCNVDIAIHPAPIAEAEELLARLADPDLLVWDCRSAEEYAGRRVTARRAGHIPGAINLDWLELMDVERDLRLIEHLPERLAERGIVPERDVVVHCHTHHRSGLAYMAARLCGFPRIRAYPGSWAEWGNRDDTPVQVGAAR